MASDQQDLSRPGADTSTDAAAAIELVGLQLCLETGGELPALLVDGLLVMTSDEATRALLTRLSTGELRWLAEKLTAASTPHAVAAQAAVSAELRRR